MKGRGAFARARGPPTLRLRRSYGRCRRPVPRLSARLEEITRSLTPEQAHAEFDETTLQVFWKRWPGVSAWAGSVWRMLSEEMAGPSTPHGDPELDEVGDSG